MEKTAAVYVTTVVIYLRWLLNFLQAFERTRGNFTDEEGSVGRNNVPSTGKPEEIAEGYLGHISKGWWMDKKIRYVVVEFKNPW